MTLVRIITTYRCNLNCFYCHKEGLKERIEINPNDIPYIVDVLKKAKVKKVTLTGGEPTLYPNLDDLILELNENKIKIGITTNGTNIKPLLRNKEYFSKITISLPATNKKIYSQVTKRDLFDQVIRNYNELRLTYEGTLKINYVFTSYSTKYLDESLELCNKLKPDEFNILPLIGKNGYTHQEVLKVFESTNFKIIYKETDIYIKKENCLFKLRKTNYSKYCKNCKLKKICGERGYVRIYPNLKVTPCLYNLVTFDLNEENLRYSMSWWEHVHSN